VLLQSLSLGPGGSDRRKPQPICDLAYNPEEIKARLAGIPVYTVANKQNEFVLVAGEVGPLPCMQFMPRMLLLSPAASQRGNCAA
jgi:hypothetical protein